MALPLEEGRKDLVPRRARRERLSAGRRLEGRCARGRVGSRDSRDAGIHARSDRPREGRPAFARRRRAGRLRREDPRPLPRLADHAEGARRRLPHVEAAPLAPLGEASRRPQGAERGRERDPRLLLHARVHAPRFAHPDPRGLRRHVEPVRDAVHGRGEGLPFAVRPALSRARGGGARKSLLLRAHVPRREVQNAPAPARVLDGRAGGRLPGDRRADGPRRGVRQGADRPRPRPPEGGSQAPRARRGQARARRFEEISASRLPRRDRDSRDEGLPGEIRRRPRWR